MLEVTGPVIAISLVLCAVFVPTAFMAGITGQFYKQFALTIAASTIISAFNSLTLSPALCALLLKPHAPGGHGHAHAEALPKAGIAIIGGLVAYVFLLPIAASAMGLHAADGGHGHGTAAPWWLRIAVFAAGAAAGWLLSYPVNFALGKLFAGFNWAFDVAIRMYGASVGLLLRLSLIVLLIYGGFMFLTAFALIRVPKGFIPEQDKGYLVVNAQLPDGASLERTNDLIRRLSEEVRKIEGVARSARLLHHPEHKCQ
jgi:multidrug efflux pump